MPSGFRPVEFPARPAADHIAAPTAGPALASTSGLRPAGRRTPTRPGLGPRAPGARQAGLQRRPHEDRRHWGAVTRDTEAIRRRRPESGVVERMGDSAACRPPVARGCRRRSEALPGGDSSRTAAPWAHRAGDPGTAILHGGARFGDRLRYLPTPGLSRVRGRARTTSTWIKPVLRSRPSASPKIGTRSVGGQDAEGPWPRSRRPRVPAHRYPLQPRKSFSLVVFLTTRDPVQCARDDAESHERIRQSVATPDIGLSRIANPRHEERLRRSTSER